MRDTLIGFTTVTILFGLVWLSQYKNNKSNNSGKILFEESIQESETNLDIIDLEHDINPETQSNLVKLIDCTLCDSQTEF